MNNISQIYQSLGKQESVFQPLPLCPLPNYLTPWNINCNNVRTKSIRKSDSGVDNVLRKCFASKMNKTTPFRETLKRTSFCFQTNPTNPTQETLSSKKCGVENSCQRFLEFTSSAKNLKRMKIKSHNEQEEIKRHLSIGKLPVQINSSMRPFNHTLLTMKSKSKSRIETRSKNIQMIRHISHKKVNAAI